MWVSNLTFGGTLAGTTSMLFVGISLFRFSDAASSDDWFIDDFVHYHFSWMTHIIRIHHEAFIFLGNTYL